ncbi:mitochondrial glutamate carrier 1-like [Watersipora subatra]|uniref:mitochondrial glutamate carrier 1-like n=1 Tax=Watersipora subatra TaxID=2589382 RepID=UPI00355B10D0
MTEKSYRFPLLPKVINGSVAGLIGVTCVFPLDLVKTRLQNQQHGALRMYSSILDCAVKTFRAEGFLGMYRGSGVNLLLITPEKTIKLVGNDVFRQRFTNQQTGQLTIPNEVLAGGCAGACQVLITTPMELLKIQMQDAGRSEATLVVTGNGQGKITPRLTAMTVTIRLLKEKGIIGLYRGCFATLLRDVSFSALYFPLFAHLNSLGKRRDRETAVFYVSFFAGLVSASVSSLMVTPFDVVKTRLQLLSKGRGEVSYYGVMDCFVRITRNEGIQALFKGGGCRVMVIAPLFGIAQVVYYLGIGQKLLGYNG